MPSFPTSQCISIQKAMKSPYRNSKPQVIDFLQLLREELAETYVRGKKVGFHRAWEEKNQSLLKEIERLTS